MELRDYFDFNSEIDIRIKGHRIAIQHVLNKYRQGKGPDELAAPFPDFVHGGNLRDYSLLPYQQGGSRGLP